MAILSQILSPEELNNLTPEKLEILSGVIHSELLTNAQVKDALTKKVKDTHKTLTTKKH
ncbi:hypothetical protein LMG27198_35340 [Methylocystis echinoides]|jgi:hypothetical protein|uniref:Uncharacterized protein n=2 Tax=Methylocystis echinoides TaxID=29468 RepID=A0A9W6GWR3_9HYPH|nr:hypothetical protein LMG27198_35340 [Methylocystis echinoides]